MKTVKKENCVPFSWFNVYVNGIIYYAEIHIFVCAARCSVSETHLQVYGSFCLFIFHHTYVQSTLCCFLQGHLGYLFIFFYFVLAL